MRSAQQPTWPRGWAPALGRGESSRTTPRRSGLPAAPDDYSVRPFRMPGQAFFFLPVRAIAPAAGAITSQSPIVTTMDVM